MITMSPFRKVGRVHAPAGGAAEQRSEEANDERERPDRRPPSGGRKRGHENQRRTRHDGARHP
jgi:hypothetical protein